MINPITNEQRQYSPDLSRKLIRYSLVQGLNFEKYFVPSRPPLRFINELYKVLQILITR